MTLARAIIPGYYFVSRRTHGGTYRTRPSRFMNQLIEFLLAVASAKYGIRIIAFSILSSHWHAILFDATGNHRAFVQYVNSLLARALNQHEGTRDSVWSGDRNPPVLLADADALLRKILYVIGNPVSSFLTNCAADWPGFITLPKDLCTLRPAVERPDGLFRLDGALTEKARLRLHKPEFPGLSSIIGDRVTGATLRAYVASELSALESEFRKKRRKAGRTVVGRTKILATSPFDSPETSKFPVLPMTEEGKSPRIAPRVATRNAGLRKSLLEWFGRFARAYGEARGRLVRSHEKRGKPPVFPFGTDLLRRAQGVVCEPRPDDFPMPLLA